MARESENPAYRSPLRCVVAGGQNSNDGDILARKISFYILRNAISDRRAGAILKRPGSDSITPSGNFGRPLGIAYRTSESADDLIPVEQEILINYAGANFDSYDGSSSTALTKDSNTSFSVTKPNTFTQIGGTLFLAGGRPAKWAATPGDRIERVGIPAPAAAITTALSGTGITATAGGYKYMYTYYNPTTELESDWSPLSASTGNFANKTVDLTIPTTAASAYGASQKRIYRTTDGGSLYYLLTTVTVATASYADTTTDTTLLANALAAPLGSRAVPPDESYLVADFNGRVFWAHGYNLYFSQQYDGDVNTVEYYPTNNYISRPDPITALGVIAGRLLVFHGRYIEQLTGYDESDFALLPFMLGTGTLFPKSVASNGKELIFFSEEGWVEIGSGQKKRISWPIQDVLDEFMGFTYNSDLYIHAEWNPSLRQFIILHSATSDDSAPWINDAGLFAEWEDTSTGSTAEWEDDGGGSATISRNLLYGWSPEYSSPEEERWHEYSFPQCPDLPDSGELACCLAHPPPSSTILSPQQQNTYIGYFDGTYGQVLKAFDRSLASDDGDTIDSVILSRRIEPGAPDGEFKRLRHLQFCGNYADPLNSADATLQYIRDIEDPHIQGFSSDLEEFANPLRDKKAFTRGKARWFNLYITDNSTEANKILLEDFYVHFVPTDSVEGR